MRRDIREQKFNENKRFELFSYFFLVIALFFPAKGFYAYHVVLFSILIPAILLRGSVGSDLKIKMLFGVFIYMVSINIVTGVWFKVDVVRNLTDAFRVVPLLLFWLYAGARSVKFSVIFNVCALYSLVNIAVVFMQFFGLANLSMINTLYASAMHAATNSWRPSGLNAGPGQSATISIATFSIFCVSALIRYRVFLSSLCALASVLAIIMAQSRSGFVALAALVFYVAILIVSRWLMIGRRPNMVALSSFGAACAITIYLLWDKLAYLSSVITSGINLHSYQAREDKWADIFNMITSNPLFLMFGHGKDFIGSQSGAVDNEYLFFLTVYGALSVVLIACLALIVLMRPFLNARNIRNPRIVLLGVTISGGAVIAWATSFLLEPRVLILLAMMFIAGFKNISKEPYHRI